MNSKWQTKTLGDLFDITSSKRVFEADWEKEGVPFYRAREIVKLAKHGFVKNELFISEEMFNRYSTKYGIPTEGDIMVTGVGTLGICYVVKRDDKFYFKDGNIIWLKKKAEVDSHFVEYAFQSDFLRKQIDDSIGATVGTFTIIKAKRTLIPVPQLSEQQRIVGILDEALESVALARTNTEKNLQNARALFESYLQSVFTARGEGWEERKLGDVCSIARGGSPRPIKKFITTASDGINWIKISDATASGKYIYKTKEKITEEGAKRSRIVHDGDFLLSNSMSFGRPYIMRATGCIHDGWLVLSNYASHLDQDYLYLILNSQFVFQQFDRLAAGSTVRNLNIELASQVEIPVPSLKQQREIAKQLDTISAETQRLESIYQRELTELDALRKSLLNAAFSGKL